MTEYAKPDLELLAARIRACRICIDKPRGKPLPHEPRPVFVESPKAKILIAGQAPGTRVHASGRPFTDPSGVRLRDWLGVTEAEFYNPDLFAIAPMGFCFPGLDAKGSDLPPRPECALAWRSELIAAMPQVRLVIAVGTYAHRWHLKLAAASMSGTVRDWQKHLSNQLPVIALPHPSWRNSGWLKRNPWVESEVVMALRTQVRQHLF